MGYDVFISYKCTDENGNKTPEYKMGEELYEALIKLGYEVFFSSDTLEKLGSSRYKADIDKALDTAKVMVVVLADPKNAESPWVRYEWDSFYNDYLSGVRKDTRLFTLTSAVIIKNLPRTLRNVQNFDYADQGIHHLCDYIKNIIPKDDMPSETICTFKENDKDISIITGRRVTAEDIKGIVDLDAITYEDKYCVDTSRCEEWFAVNTVNGEKFCNLFGMKKVKSSEHSSTLYEVTLIPPKFKIISKTSKKLFDYYQKKYDEAPYLFDD